MRRPSYSLPWSCREGRTEYGLHACTGRNPMGWISMFFQRPPPKNQNLPSTGETAFLDISDTIWLEESQFRVHDLCELRIPSSGLVRACLSVKLAGSARRIAHNVGNVARTRDWPAKNVIAKYLTYVHVLYLPSSPSRQRKRSSKTESGPCLLDVGTVVHVENSPHGNCVPDAASYARTWRTAFRLQLGGTYEQGTRIYAASATTTTTGWLRGS
ncbi:hypothetical protein J3F83DRAFT_679905 [Trichoderma novae-zelandiae]